MQVGRRGRQSRQPSVVEHVFDQDGLGAEQAVDHPVLVGEGQGGDDAFPEGDPGREGARALDEVFPVFAEPSGEGEAGEVLEGEDQARLVFPTHLVPDHANALAKALHGHEHLIPRSMLVRKLQPLPVEAVVRGYLAGGGFKEYQKTGAILDHPLPAGLLDGSKLPQPIFTPSTKAAEGHDEAITRARCGEILGEKVFRTIQETSLALYRMGAERAAKAGVILADTKFEFGTAPDGSLVLIDEVLTPDSSRYWPAATWQPGRAQPSYDKQFVRDWLETQPWDKTAPGPTLPGDVVHKTQPLYAECLERLTA